MDKNMIKPKVSVIMPVYNSEKYLREAIESILNQTYPNFEFIIIDDGSTDNSYKIAKSYKDSRIKIFRHKKNKGIVDSLNEGIKKSTGKYIIRMDSDDISMSKRIKTQVLFMEKNLNVGVCGSWIKVFGAKNYTWKTEVLDKHIRVKLFFESAIAHPSACIRKLVLDKYSLVYQKKYEYVEDYMLWLELSKVSQLANISQTLLKYRLHSSQIGSKKSTNQNTKLKIIRKYLLHQFINKPTTKQTAFHNQSMSWNIMKNIQELNQTKTWYEKLLLVNKKKNIYDNNLFIKLLAEKWIGKCYLSKDLGRSRYFHALNSSVLFTPSLKKYIEIKTSSIKQYLIATQKRFI
jgi:glycosyltransferase involved in cell wall biosynthesis